MPTRKRLIAIVAAVSVVAGACGSDAATTSTASDAAAAAGQGSIPVDSPLALQDLDPDGPQFGDSLDTYFGSTADSSSDHNEPERVKEGNSAPTGDFTTIEWDDLIPAGYSNEDIFAKFEAELDAVDPGSPEADVIYQAMQDEFDGDVVTDDFDGQEVFLAGFVAPLTYSGELVTELLLVPYFGACIHVPPPPANQTVLVTLEEGAGVTFEEAWGPIWVTGKLTVTPTDTEIGSSGYSIDNAQYGVYEDGY